MWRKEVRYMKEIVCPNCEIQFHSYDNDFEGIPEHICLKDEVK